MANIGACCLWSFLWTKVTTPGIIPWDPWVLLGALRSQKRGFRRDRDTIRLPDLGHLTGKSQWQRQSREKFVFWCLLSLPLSNMDQTSRKIINFEDFDVWDSKDFWQINHSIEDPVTDHTQDQSRPFCFPLLLTVGPEVDENVEQRISNFAKFSPKTALGLTGHVEFHSKRFQSNDTCYAAPWYPVSSLAWEARSWEERKFQLAIEVDSVPRKKSSYPHDNKKSQQVRQHSSSYPSWSLFQLTIFSIVSNKNHCTMEEMLYRIHLS